MSRKWWQCLIVALLALSGCRSGTGGDTAPEVTVRLALQPDPPAVGMATAALTLTDEDGSAVRGAAVKLEGNMNHAGMRPVFAEAKEGQPGHYQAELEFTMGGDWFILVDARLADGRKLQRKIDVPAVQSR